MLVSLFAPRSLRARLIVILSLLVAAAIASGFIMFGLFEQSTTAQIGQAAAVAGRACDAIGRSYRFYATGWRSGAPNLADKEVRQGLAAVTFTALRDKPAIEGGFWEPDAGAFAYAFPTYEGSGPKTDVPQAELTRIAATNQQAQKEDRPQMTRLDSGAQTLLISACLLPGPIPHLSAWTMTRVHSLTGKTYWQLMTGLGILALLVGLAFVMATALIMTWSKHVARIVGVLAAQSGDEPPILMLTGERELDYIVKALNDSRQKVISSHQQAESLARQVSTSERLAAVGRVTAGVAHEFRNPLAAMRLKSEAALAGAPERKAQALSFVIGQIDRIDHIIGRLLSASERDPLRRQSVALEPFLASCAEPFRTMALAKSASLSIRCEIATGWFDPDQMTRAVNSLVLNALQEDAPGAVVVSASIVENNLVLAVSDRGDGPPEAIRDHLFDPFVSGRPDRAGLGLAIVREVAAAHGGYAQFSRDDVCTVFRIVTPCHAS
jgi:signal transduction histidine kinase